MLVLCTMTGYTQQQADNKEKELLRQLGDTKADSARVIRLLETGSYYVNKPGEETGDMHKALAYCRQALDLSNKTGFTRGEGGAYALMAQIYREKGDRKTGKTFAEKALTFFKNTPVASPEAAAAWMEMSQYYTIDNDSDIAEKVRLYKNAIDILKVTAPNTIQLADALKFMGDLYGLQAEYPLALTLLKDALDIYHAHHKTDIQDILSLLGQMSVQVGQLKEGLNYQLQAVRLAEQAKDSTGTAMALYNRLGYIYNSLNKLPESVSSYEKSLQIAKRNHDTSAILVLSSNIAWSNIRMQQERKAIRIIKSALDTYPVKDTAIYIHIVTTMMEAYTSLKEYDESAYYYNRLLPNVRNTHSTEPYILNFQYAAINLFLAKHDLPRIAPHVAWLNELSKQTTDLRKLGAIQRYLFLADSANGNYVQAIQHYQRYKRLFDSIGDRNHDKQIAQMELQFQTEKKDLDIANKAKDIQSLQQKNELQQRTLRSEAISRSLLIAALILVILLLAVGYSRYRLKQQANKQLEEKQTAINLQNESLKQLVNEREWLLKEIHHRVKNNLQIVISLLNSQSVYLEDNAALSVIKESQHRMNSISLIHQKLYQGTNLSGIDMRDYIYELVLYLQDSFDTRGRIAFLPDVDRIVLDVSQAVPLGLILNEAITNAIKYAFTDQEEPKIFISLKQSDDHTLMMTVRDNGKGLPGDFDINTCTSLGVNLMQGLAKQLGGKLEMRNDKGVHMHIFLQKINLLSTRDNGTTNEYQVKI